jgi:hypothetical protein
VSGGLPSWDGTMNDTKETLMSGKGRKTLKELIRFPYIFSCNKYNYAEDADEHATDKIDKLSISQFLDVLSDALEEILND